MGDGSIRARPASQLHGAKRGLAEDNCSRNVALDSASGLV